MTIKKESGKWGKSVRGTEIWIRTKINLEGGCDNVQS